MEFSKELIHWYLKNKRELPWRKTKDPYCIWLSEIMLQQTRIAQGMPYYYRFIEAFPNVFSLAEAPLEKVLKLWQGLGYYSRARNLHATAQRIAFEREGEFPKDYKGLLKLKGVGDYTASAIASICYGEPTAVVDGNVYRVLARFFGIETPINSTAGNKEFKALANRLLDKEDPSSFNQALMEFGALQCTPKNPACKVCPLNSSCLALKNNTIALLPVKIKKGKIKKRYFNYLVFHSQAHTTFLEQRKGKGIWQGLYEFPLVESKKEVDEEELASSATFRELVKAENFKLELLNEKPVVHKLSHQHIYAKFWRVQLKQLPKQGISMYLLLQYPVPVLIQNFLKEWEPENWGL